MALLKITHFWSNLLPWGYQHDFPIWGYQHIFGALDWCMSFRRILWIVGIHWLYICMVTIWYKSMEGETPASSESRLFTIEHSKRAKGVLRAKMEMGVSPLTCRWGPVEEIKQELTLRD